MTENRRLQMLQDTIGDLLSDEEVSPEEIMGAIKQEVTELRDYHLGALNRTTSLLRLIDQDTGGLHLDFSKFTDDYNYEDVQDEITFGNANKNVIWKNFKFGNK